MRQRCVRRAVHPTTPCPTRLVLQGLSYKEPPPGSVCGAGPDLSSDTGARADTRATRTRRLFHEHHACMHCSPRPFSCHSFVLRTRKPKTLTWFLYLRPGQELPGEEIGPFLENTVHRLHWPCTSGNSTGLKFRPESALALHLELTQRLSSQQAQEWPEHLDSQSFWCAAPVCVPALCKGQRQHGWRCVSGWQFHD